MFRPLAILLFLLSGPVLAEPYPDHENLFVNDYANLLDDVSEATLREQLQTLRDTMGIEATVLTIYTRWAYDTPTEGDNNLESFATGLFNGWGIGNADKNDGILILVVSEDREMRVELGSGYGTAYNDEAQAIIDSVFLPAFRSGDFQGGIVDGTDRVVENIALEHAAGHAEPTKITTRPITDTSTSGGVGWIFGAIGGAVVLMLGAGIFGRRIRDRFATCPQCGQKGMHTEKHVLEAATKSTQGRGERIVTCAHCDYRLATPYTIAMVSSSSSSSSSSGGSFGGGSSSGGGASGSW